MGITRRKVKWKVWESLGNFGETLGKLSRPENAGVCQFAALIGERSRTGKLNAINGLRDKHPETPGKHPCAPAIPMLGKLWESLGISRLSPTLTAPRDS